MTDLFFTYEDKLPAGVGYRMFGKEHLLILFLCLVLIIFLFIVYKKGKRPDAVRRFAGFFPVFLTVLRGIYVFVAGADIRYELPLHLCALTGILCFLFELSSAQKRLLLRVIGQVLYALGLPGALMALLFPNGTMYPPVHFITIESFLFHALIIAHVILCLDGGLIRPRLRDAALNLFFLVPVVPAVYFANRCLRSNYMFLSVPSLGSPLLPVYQRFGYGGYLCVFALLTAVVVVLMNAVGEFLIKMCRRDTGAEE